ncbi:hypothetical protein RhiirB3_403939 [Rhizophagus irregularis]|nr:hypothetical protein RhiirB3_403939 [Rhizophagus irregularis]
MDGRSRGANFQEIYVFGVPLDSASKDSEICAILYLAFFIKFTSLFITLHDLMIWTGGKNLIALNNYLQNDD